MATGPSGYSACSPSSGRGTWPEAPGRNRQIGQRVSNRFVESARCALQVRPSVAVLLPLHNIEDIRELLAPVPKRLGLLAPHWNAIAAQPRVRRVWTALDNETQRGSSFMAGAPFRPIPDPPVRSNQPGRPGRRPRFRRESPPPGGTTG